MATEIKPREKMMESWLSKVGTKEWQEKYHTFFVSGEDETKRRMALPKLGPKIIGLPLPQYILESTVRVDEEGKIYTPFWHQTSKIPERSIILGAHQLWRNYAGNPPKTKTYHELGFSYIRAGIDVALRRSKKVGGKYDKFPEAEASETNKMVQHVNFLKAQRTTIETLDTFTEENEKELALRLVKYAEQNISEKTRDQYKKRAWNLALRGYRDKNGKPSRFVATNRLFCAEYALRKKLEMHPSIFNRYNTNSELLNYKRQQERKYLENVNKILLFIEQQNFETIGDARVVYKGLKAISFGLLANIAARPYLLGARKAVENFGCINLPQETIAEKVNNRRREKGIPTVSEYLACGDFVQTKALVNQTRSMLQKILDIHQDYKTVKPSGRFKK